MTFAKVCLRHLRAGDDPAGDLIRIRDVRDDSRLPDDFNNIGEMRGYLRLRGACRQCLEVVPEVWRRYRRWADRHLDWRNLR